MKMNSKDLNITIGSARVGAAMMQMNRLESVDDLAASSREQVVVAREVRAPWDVVDSTSSSSRNRGESVS